MVVVGGHAVVTAVAGDVAASIAVWQCSSLWKLCANWVALQHMEGPMSPSSSCQASAAVQFEAESVGLQLDEDLGLREGRKVGWVGWR